MGHEHSEVDTSLGGRSDGAGTCIPTWYLHRRKWKAPVYVYVRNSTSCPQQGRHLRSYKYQVSSIPKDPYLSDP